ncbi:MAG: sulfatase-like hydrolase/transferase, partial [Gemmatimonadota bacterium]
MVSLLRRALLLDQTLAVVAACLLAFAACGRGERPGAADTRPNILFVFADDHAAHAVSAYGSRINETPQIDRLAQEGMLFHNAFVTNAICAPSRAVILTGTHS